MHCPVCSAGVGLDGPRHVVMAHRTPLNPPPHPSQPHAGPIWLSVEQIRKRERMRRERVIAAMETGELPFEQRGRIRYARLSDVIAWGERRINTTRPQTHSVRIDLSDLI